MTPAPDATSPAPDTDPSHLAILKAVDEVREEVAKNRGLAWKKTVPAEVLTRDQLKARLEEMIKEDFDAKKFDMAVKLARRLGMLTADQDPLAIEKKYTKEQAERWIIPVSSGLIAGESLMEIVVRVLVNFHVLTD